MGCAMHTGQRQPLVRTSLARRVPSGKSMRPSRAYFAYEAESKRSHPRRAARGKTSGWPAPNRWTGFAGSRTFFDAMMTRTRSRNRYASRRGTTPRIAHTATSRDDTDLAQRSRRSAWRPPWTAPTRAISPRRETASWARRSVSSTSFAARLWSWPGSENTSSIVPKSAWIAFWKAMTSAFVMSTSPYTWDWNAPESVMTAPGKPRNWWMPTRTIASRPGDFPRMYAFVIRICAPNRVARSLGGTIGRFGLTTGARVGVATRPCAVSSTPIRASPSRSRISNMRSHRSAANKAFPWLRERNRLSGHRDDRAVDGSGRGDGGRSVRRDEETIVHPRRQPGRSSRGDGTRETPRHLQRLSLRRAVPSEGVPPDGPGPDPPRPRASAAATRIRRRPQGDRVAGRDPAERGDDGPRGLRRGAALARVRRGR